MCLESVVLCLVAAPHVDVFGVKLDAIGFKLSVDFPAPFDDERMHLLCGSHSSALVFVVAHGFHNNVDCRLEGMHARLTWYCIICRHHHPICLATAAGAQAGARN